MWVQEVSETYRWKQNGLQVRAGEEVESVEVFEECSVYRKGVACREDRSEVNAAEGIVMSSKKKVSGEVGEEGHGGSWAVGKRAAAHASVYKPARFAGENTGGVVIFPLPCINHRGGPSF